MTSLFLIICFAIYGSRGFLLDSSTRLPGTGNSALSDRHYIQLMDSLYEEKKARQNLEVIVSNLMKKVQTTTPNPIASKINHLEEKYATVLQELKLVKDENKNLTHQLHNMQTVQDISKLNNDINLLKATDQARTQDLIALNTIVQITSQNVSTLLDSNLKRVQGISMMKTDINSLKATNQARNQDVIALHTMATSTSRKLDNVSKLLASNVQNVTALDSSMTQIESRQSHILHQLQQTQQKLTNDSRKVMIRACDAKKDLSSLLRFSGIKESYGISNTANFISSGKFTCEDAGLYILMVIVFADPSGADVNIYKNSIIIQHLELRIPENHSYYHTIPGSLVLSLDVGDTIHVHSAYIKLVNESSSCLSIIKIR